MTSLLSTISGQFTRNLILGYFLPVVVFVVLSMIFITPIFPADWPLLKGFLGFGIESKVIALSFITIVTTGLLFNLNTPLLRFYEGYPWRDSWIGRAMRKRKQKRFAVARARRLGLRALLRAMDKTDQRRASLEIRLKTGALALVTGLPSNPSLILPTRFGNVLRSFEEYPTRQYNMDAVTLWPRLLSKIDKEHAAGLDDAKTSVDFMVNMSVLSFLSAAIIIVAGWYYFPPASVFHSANTASTRSLILIWSITLASFLILGYLAYLGAIERASAWGAWVKGAFDLYRGELLKQLGYERAGLTLRQERYLWNSISGELLYGDPPWGRHPNVEYHIDKTRVYCDAPVDLDFTRGVQRNADSTLTITIRIENIDSQKRSAKRVRLVDTLPVDFSYVWGSASNGTHTLRVVGANPYRFEIGDMKQGDETILTYLAMSQSGNK